jgi:non-canonical purine NTP pyrophosphatase (RdgB/HAM1 family)
MAKNFTFISGNQKKVDQLTAWLGLPFAHHKLDLDELQSLDLRAVAEHKVRQAYDILQSPVLVDDVALTFDALGRLPGTYIKWFVQELDVDGLCKLAAGLDHQKAAASICYAWFDGHILQFFEHTIPGRIAPEPRGSTDFGWNAVFIPDGATKTYGEMTDDEKQPFSMRAAAIEDLRTFLTAA